MRPVEHHVVACEPLTLMTTESAHAGIDRAESGPGANASPTSASGSPTFSFTATIQSLRGHWVYFTCQFDSFGAGPGPGYIELLTESGSARRLPLGAAEPGGHSSLFFVPEETLGLTYTPLSGAAEIRIDAFHLAAIGRMELLRLLLSRAYRAHKKAGGNFASLARELRDHRRRRGSSLRTALLERYGLRAMLPAARRVTNDMVLRQDLESSVAHRPDAKCFAPLSADSLVGTTLSIKAIAFYLPQFHPIEENNRWWGRGFTEWTNVSKALPQFEGHYQPRVPGELGYYDLRIASLIRRQVELAEMHGIHAFCFYYYWFNGKRLLSLPLQLFSDDPSLTFPFCICWANENWTRTWDGADNEILIEQAYSAEDDVAFIEALRSTLLNKRYLRIDDKPLILVYRPSQLPNAKETFARWRHDCREHGIGEIHLAGVLSFVGYEPEQFGLDATVEFPPHLTDRLDVTDQQAFYSKEYSGTVYDFASLVETAKQPQPGSALMYRTAMPGWDNEARKPGRGMSFVNSSPARYADWLGALCEQAMRRPPQDRLVFINAWNEWGEGAYLEPDRKYGYAYLQATKNVLRRFAKPAPEIDQVLQNSQARAKKSSDYAFIIHLFYESLWDELERYLLLVRASDLFISVSVTISPELVHRITASFPNAYLFSLGNKGRDILPFAAALDLINELGYLAVCKVHTKRSPFRTDGDTLRTAAYEALMGIAQRPQQVLDAFKQGDLGILAPAASLIALADPRHMAASEEQVGRLAKRLTASFAVGNEVFPAGSMYWFRPAALEPLRKLKLCSDDFPPELGQVDGTTAHAVERVIGLSATLAGYKIEAIEAALGMTKSTP